MTPGRAPSMRLERDWLGGFDRKMGSEASDGPERPVVAIAGCDEVGRGALGGPVSVGIVVVDAVTRRPPTGLRDSKLLTAPAREALVPRIVRWASASAVGHASAAEIDGYGLLSALRVAGERALAMLPLGPDMVLLDGNYDWMTRPPPVPTEALPSRRVAPVTLKVAADRLCASVAAASVLAKVTRDAMMVERAQRYPEYGWDQNKGYATPAHLDALRRFGPCGDHRCSWAPCGGALSADDLEVEEEQAVGGGAA